ncbi:MAG: hypothetical protein JWR80_10138 [Bradyrhizobium sp.]|nr:hypothetical protein [Bradyrhizobium sp.]
MDAGRPLADWRSAAPYERLATCGRHGFAWEWLRRSAAYRRAVEDVGQGRGAASRFGLIEFEPVGLGVPDARPVWRADADPHVVIATAAPASGEREAFDFAALAPLGRCVDGPDGTEHWLWSDGVRQVRLDVIAGTLRSGPVQLDFRIPGFGAALTRLATIERLVALVRTGRLMAGLFPAEARAQRWALILRTYDAMEAGASQRDIAECLFSLSTVSRWRVEAPSCRLRVQRLVAAARMTANVNPRRWLDASWA